MRKNWALVVEDQDVKLEAVDPALIAESRSTELTYVRNAISFSSAGFSTVPSA